MLPASPSSTLKGVQNNKVMYEALSTQMLHSHGSLLLWLWFPDQEQVSAIRSEKGF